MTSHLPLILRARWVILALTLCFVLLSSLGMSQLYFRGDYRIFFDQDNPQVQAFELMQQEFNKSDNILIGIAPQSRDVFQEDILQLVREYTEAAWQTPYSIRVDSLSNFQHTTAENDDLLVADLVPDASLSVADITQIRNIATAESALVNRLVAPDGAVTAINITVQLPEPTQQQQVTEIWEFVTELSATFAARYPDVEFHHTGIIALNHAFASEAEQDVRLLVPLMLAAILLMLAFLLRSIAGALVTLLIVAVTVTSTLGIAGWFGIFMSTATVNVPTILMTLAVADSVHLLASMQFAMAAGKTKPQAIYYSLQRNWQPVLITSLTTAIGFLTLNFSEVPILRDLGNLTALGVMLACVYSLLILPILMSVLPLKPAKPKQNSRQMSALANLVIQHQRLFIWGFLLLTVVCALMLPLNRINDEANKYFAANTSFRQANDFMEQNLSGFTSIDFMLSGDSAGAVNQPELLKALDAFALWLQQQPEVMHVNSLSDVLKRLNKNMHQDDPAYYRLPETPEEAAQYLLLFEMSLPFGLDLSNQLNIDKSATRLTATLFNLGSKDLLALEQRALSYFAANYPQYQLSAASAALTFAYIGERNMASMLTTLPLALLLISILLLISLRSWRLGLVSIIPNLLPLAIGFGIWGLVVGEINLALSVVASMSLGIIVDDTVHFLSKYQYARKEGRDSEQAVRYAFESVGRALWITTVVLVVGFGVLVFSNFRLNSDMGFLTSGIILVALAVDLLFLPACLVKWGKTGRSADANAATTKTV